MTNTVADVIRFLETVAAPQLAEEWDNVGLLLGDDQTAIQSVMTCLTLTPDVAEEAVREKAGLVVTHHPILFRSVQKITTRTNEGRMLMQLIRAGVAVYSPHTSFDNGVGGINQWIAEQLGLNTIVPLRPDEGEHSTTESGETPIGSGRFGNFSQPMSWTNFHNHLRNQLHIKHYQSVQPNQTPIQRVGIACGAAAEFLQDAHREGCDAFITGEARFHACLEARNLGIGMILLGHYASERPALDMLAKRLSSEFPQMTTWASQEETDPIEWIV